MEFSPLGCQVCLIKFQKVCKLKKHIYSHPHRQKMLEMFGKDVSNCRGFFPYIVLMESINKRDNKQPIQGLSLLTLCFSRESESHFYLCHICEEKCPQESIMYHLSTGEHCSNYFNFTDPDVLHFSWIPKKDMRAILRPPFAKNVEESGLGTLQILDLPENLYKRLERSIYSEVMHTLRENDKLKKCLEAVIPRRTMIQTYHRDRKRKNPLLGMQHIVECICDGPNEKRYYLCTLCKLTLATHMIIKHVLSFDHVYNYFKAWHPSTLASKESYKDYKESMMLNLAKQSLGIFGAPNNEMKQVSLEASEFASVNFACYEKALKKLEAITKEKNGINLITSIKPGVALEVETPCCTRSAVLTCQNCSLSFDNVHAYLDHLSKRKHNQMLNKIFGEANRARGYERGGYKPYLGLYRYLKRSLVENHQIIGVSLVVACVNTEFQTETIYVCFACQESFPESVLREHFKSIKHLIHTMLYHNPWRLHFAWEKGLDVTDLSSKAWEEEKERAPNQIKMKVLDVPYWIFCNLISPTYEKVMKKLELQHTVLKRDVPRRETYSKLQQNERFPLLGQQFIVMYSVGQNHSTKVAFLCLLCERTLSDIECHAHVFSREHVEKFLDRHHPGTLTLGINAETLLDLAKQAGRINPISTVQVIKLDTPIWEPYSYQRAICILASAKKRDKKGALEPPITPKMKLAPRETVKEMVRDHVRDNSPQDGKTVEGPEKKISKTSRDNVDANVKKIAVDINTLNSNKDIKSDTDEEKGDNKDTLPPSDKLLSEKKRECPETRSEETKGAGNDTCLVIKEENTEKPITIEPSGAIPASHQSKDEDDAAETEKENKISKDVLKKCKDYMDNKIEKKRPGIKSEKTETDICSDKDVQREMGHKSQQLTSKKGSCCVKTQKVQSSGLKQEASEDDAENCKPSHETAKITAPPDANHQPVNQLWQYIRRKDREPVVGLNGLFECHCNEHDTIYLCEYCSEIIPEKNIISHVTGFSHQKMYLENLPPLSQMNQMEHVRHLAVKSECSNGYGEAQVLDLDEDVYCTMFKQDFKSAIQSVKTLQAQQQSMHELPSVSTLPSVQNLQHVNTTVTLQKQCEVHSMKDNIQVVEMEIDNGSEDPNILLSPVTVAMSALPETSSKTTEVRPKSTKDVTFAHSKVSESADNPVPRSGDRVSKSGTNTTTLHPDYTEKISKDDIAPRTLVEPLTETAPASKTVSKVVCEATQTTAASFKTENTSKNSEAVSGPAVTLKNMATPVATDKNPVKSENTEASAKTLPIKNSNVHVGPHEHKSNPPAAIQSTASVSVSVEQTGVSTNKVGVNQLIVVSCQRSQQVYCQLCSVRLMASTHVNTNMHKYNYVKMKYPEWNAKPTEKEKLDKIVARLAEVEKDVECRHPQTIYVYIEEYRELAALPENIAVEKVKAMIAKRGMSKLPTSTADSVEASRQQVAFTSQYEVSSPDEETYMPKNEMPVLCTTQQSEQDNKQKPQNWTDTAPEAKDVNAHQFHSHPGSIKNNPKSIPTPSGQEPGIAAVQLEQFGCVNPLATSSECAGSLDQNLSTCKETSENRHQKERRYQELQDTLEMPPPVFSSTDAISSGASINTEQQNQSRPSHKTERVLTCVESVPEPGNCSALGALPRISIGESTQGRSNLSKFLTVKKLDKPIIGLGSVWECQGISQGMSQNSFYLCECCSEKISVTDICHHMSSFPHLHQCMMKQYSQFTRSVYNAKNVPHEEKIDILEDIAKMLSKQESYRNTDAQVVMLSHGLHESVQKAPFDKAIEIVHNIKKLNKLKVFYQPPNTPQQKDKQPENQQSQKQSPHMEMQSTLEHGTRHQIENERRKKPEKHKLEETVMIQDLDGIKRKKVSSSQDLNSVSSETEFMASSIHLGYRPISPQETHGSLSVQPAQLTSTKKRLEVSTPDTHDLQHQSSLNAESMFGNESQLKPSSVYAVTTNNDANQIPQPQSNDATGRTRICQMPINAIVTARPDPIINQSMGDYEGQVHRELHEGIEIPHHLPTVATTPIDNMAASEVYGQCSQTAFITAGPSGYVSSEAVTGHTTPGNPPIYTEGLEHMEKYNTRALYPSQVYSEQEGIQLNLHSLGLSLATPASPGLMSLEMHWRQQQEMMMMMMQQKQQMMMMMQQQQHQQYPSCVSAPLPAVNGNVTNDAGNIYNVSSSTAANNPQVFTNLSTSSTASPQNSISMVTQNFSQMYSNPPTSSLFYNQQ
ncbi:uncharacterized protein [Channa argus]|uniref:uncharacterized protein isoform X2 n=1 Tax=Channa argus TaxID=215402 RepID=UPI003520E8EE